ITMTRYTNRLAVLKTLTTETLKAYGFEGQLANLAQLDAAERAFAKTVYESLTSQKDRAKVVEESAKRHIELMKMEMDLQLAHVPIVNAAVLAEFDAQVKLNAEWGLNAAGALKLQTTAADTLRIALDALHETKVKGIS